MKTRPSSTKKQLQERWDTTAGSETRQALFAALIHNTSSRDQIRSILARLPLSDEIASGLDFRALRDVPFLNKLDLSDASFDYGSVDGPVMGCDLSRASLVEFDARNLHLQSQFRDARLERANLSNARLMGANFSGANLAKAKLTSASMSGVNFTGAKLVEADLRFCVLANADLTGADLTDAKLVEAALGGVSFDESTIVRNADLSGAALDDDFLTFARKGEAKVGGPEGAYEVAELDATIAVLKEQNRDGHLSDALTRLEVLRERVVVNPNFDWGSIIARQVSPEIFREVEDALQEGAASLGEHV